MKKKFITLLPIAFLLFSCDSKLTGLSIGGWQPFAAFKKEKTEKEDHKTVVDDIIEEDQPEDLTKHATSLSADPNAPFYLFVGETRDVKVTLSPSPTLDSEKKFTWSDGKELVKVEVDEKSTNKAKITGLKAGTVTITATNTYNTDLNKTFTIKVLDSNKEDVYLWQYKTEDRKQFGYDYNEAKQGTPEGVAVLNGMSWSYKRSSVTSCQSSMGAVGFGKGGAPETHIHLEAENERVVESFVIEAASANSLAKMTVKVGDQVFLNEVTVPKAEWDVIGSVSSDIVPTSSGKITIDIYTPEYDSSRADDDSYLKPGAFYLKSILMSYKSEVIEKIQVAEDSKHLTDFFKEEGFTIDGLKLEKVSTRGIHIPVDIDAQEELKNLTITPPNFEFSSHVAQEVKISLIVDGYDNPFTTSYWIHIRELAWTPEAIEIVGSIANQVLIEGDEVDYSPLSIRVVYEAASEDFMYYPFEESDIFAFSYGVEGDPFVAEKIMEQGYTITIVGNFVPVEGIRTKTVSTTFTVSESVLNITEAIYDRIDFRRAKTYEKLDLKSDAKQLSYLYEKTERLRIDFDSVKKGYRLSDHKELPITLKDFHITCLDKNLSIEKANIEFAAVSSKDNNYRLFSSIYGGDIYGDELAQAKNRKIVFNGFVEHTNNLLLTPGLTSTGSTVNANTGIASILIRYVEKPQVEYSLSCDDSGLVKQSYMEGEMFDPTGLTVSLNQEGSSESLDITEYVSWYDGSTYEESPQSTLTPASHTVVGVFHEKTFEVAILGVEERSIPLTLVKDVSEFDANGKYYIVCPSTNVILKGSSKNADLLKKTGSEQVESLSFNDQININILFEDDYMVFTPTEDGKFTISTPSGGFIGLTAGGAGTCSGTCPYRNFDISINQDGTFNFEVSAEITKNDETTTKTMYLGGGDGLINLYTSNKANLAVYKA